MSQEIWKEVPDYSMYEVSTHGRVRSWKNGKWGRRKEPRILKAWLNSDDYPMVNLWENGWRKMFKVHTLVLTAFIGPRHPGTECCHGDGNRTNNYLPNLRWDTRSANQQDAIAHGTHMPHRGEANGVAKLTKAEVIEIRRLYIRGGVIQATLGAQFGVSRATVSHIINRRSWSHLA